MSYPTSKYSHLTDNELVKHYKTSADKIYVGELYKRYTHLVLGMCINYFKDKDVAKDNPDVKCVKFIDRMDINNSTTSNILNNEKLADAVIFKYLAKFIYDRINAA